MSRMLDSPFMLFAVVLVALWLAARAGMVLGRRKRIEGEERDDFGIIVAATLTLLGLIIGFTFSMAISGYDQRKNYEESEANAIGTEYVRADMLPANDVSIQHLALSTWHLASLAFVRTGEEVAESVIQALKRGRF